MINQGSKKYLSDDVIKLIEILRKEEAVDTLSPLTKNNYVAEMRRTVAKLAARNLKTPADLYVALGETRSKATYYRRLAAAHYFLRTNILHLTAKLDAANNEQEIANACRSLEFFAELKRLMIANAGLCQISDPRPRSSKRSLLGRLSKDGDFREKMYERLRDGKYQLAFLLAAISGARPQELQNGLLVRIEGQTLSIKIAGSKVKINQGQEFRTITYDLCAAPSNFMLSEILRLLGSEAAHGVTVSVNSKVNFTSALRRAGKMIWPHLPDVTPYVLRHAIASQWKQILDPDDVSIALGHSSSKTRTRYGQAQLMRGASHLAPKLVRGSRAVRVNDRSSSPKFTKR